MSFIFAENINPYLIDAQAVVVTARKHPICNVLNMNNGNRPIDGGFLLLNETEKEEIIKESPVAQKWIRPFIGAEEFLNGKKRWCLWLVDADPSELRKCKSIMKRIENVKNFRLSSKKAATRKLAELPALFGEVRQPFSDYLVVPEITSEKRKYYQGLPVTTSAFILPFAFSLRYVIFGLDYLYGTLMLITGILFIVDFKVPKIKGKGLAALGILVIVELVQIVCF